MLPILLPMPGNMVGNLFHLVGNTERPFHNIDFLFIPNASIFTFVKWIEYISNALFWIFTGWIITSSFSIQGQEIEILNGEETVRTIHDANLAYQLIVCIGISFCLFYLNLLNIHSLASQKNKLRALTFSIILFLTGLLIFRITKEVFFAHYLALPIQISSSVILFYFAISSTYWVIKIWVQSEQRQKI